MDHLKQYSTCLLLAASMVHDESLEVNLSTLILNNDLGVISVVDSGEIDVAKL